MSEDPFATAADEAQAEPVTDSPADDSPFNEPPAEAPKKTAAKKAAPKKAVAKLEQNDGGKVTVTLKGGKDFDSPWIVIHADSVEDAYEQMSGDSGTLLAELMDKVAKAGGFFASKAPAKPAGGNGGGGNRGGGYSGGGGGNGRPQAAAEAPGGEKRYCNHGEMVFKSGVSKAGKPYKLFSCTGPRQEQCDAQFLR
ncbi:hypothetical protein ACWF99_23845 [Nocardia sp. NPDC055002]